MDADQAPAQPSGDKAPPSPGLPKRTRAPTITIDTSQVSKTDDLQARKSHEMTHSIDEDRRSDQEPSRLRSPSNAVSVGSDRPSFDRDSRPTSPHNISSPTQWGTNQTFLAVPAQSRSRGQSFDTNASGETSSTSDFTYVNTHSIGDAGHKAGEDDGQRFGAGDHPILSDQEALKPDAGTEADFHRDNNPFAFAPGHMGKLLNPKSLGAFHAVGGLPGLTKGLRTDRNAGLTMDEDKLDGAVSFEQATSAPIPDSGSTAVESPTDTSRPVAQEKAGGNGSFNDRKLVFGENVLPEKKPKTIFQLMWLAYNDKVLWVLTVAAVIALALGLYQHFRSGGVEWVEGVAIIVAIVIVVSVGAINDWQKERQFAKLNKKKESREVKVVRSGKIQTIDVHSLLVGDLLLVEAGDILPVDGIFVTGHGVKCDESSATGESDILKKTAGDEVLRAMDAGESVRKMDPFLISGGKVTEGYGRMLVTSVGVHSSYGKTMLSLQDDTEATPLQSKLNTLAEYIAKLGSAAALLLFVILLIKFLAGLSRNTGDSAAKGQEFINILITAVTIIVVAVPEGLPLAVTLALAYATRRMLKDNNLVRVLRSCETMGNATTVCSDKTGTLTQNVMTVVAGAIGTSNRFSNRAVINKDDEESESSKKGHHVDDISLGEFVKALSQPVRDLWKDSIAINSTAFEGEEEGRKVFIGSKTETALLDLASAHLGMGATSVERDNAEVAQLIPFDSVRKCMGVVIKLREKGQYRLLVKGASEIMLGHSTSILRDPTHGLETTAMSSANKQTFENLIEAYASRSLRTIGFIYRDIASESWPPKGVRRSEDDKTQAVFEDLCKNMTFLGMVGIQDPLRHGVIEAVADCLKAGVFPRMVTGDNITTAKAIATECGIYTPGGLALDGPKFRDMSRAEQRAIIPKLQVLARSSPDDKRVLVKRLKEMGETVAVTGDGTNDAPALKLSDVGFSMNIAGTEVAKEASDIILMDDNFSSIVNALMWGRAVNDAVRKFLQFQITVNITAVLLAFISAVSNDEEKSVLTAVQLLWINLIMDTMAALALATDPPSRKILDRKPDPKSAPLISVNMWKMIIGQAIYQLTVTLILYFAGWNILNYDERPENLTDQQWFEEEQPHRHALLETLVFNTFTWMQIFNALNNRRLDNRFNVFEGIQKNMFFIGIFLVMIGGQVLIVFVGGAAFNVEPQTGMLWGIALVLGALALPIGVVIRLIPDEVAARMVPRFVREWSARRKDRVVVTDEENPFQFNQALYDIKDELSWLKKYKGGRLNGLRFAVQHPKAAILGHSRTSSRSRSRDASVSLPRTPNNEAVELHEEMQEHSPKPATPESRRWRSRSRSNSALAGAAMAGIIAGSVAGGWSPVDGRRSGDNENLWPRERSKSDLSREVLHEAHPETKQGDTLVVPQDPVREAGNQPPSQSEQTTPQFDAGPFGGEPSSSKDKKDGSD